MLKLVWRKKGKPDKTLVKLPSINLPKIPLVPKGTPFDLPPGQNEPAPDTPHAETWLSYGLEARRELSKLVDSLNEAQTHIGTLMASGTYPAETEQLKQLLEQVKAWIQTKL